MNRHSLRILLALVRDLRLVFACAFACLMYACGPSVGATNSNFQAGLRPTVTVSAASAAPTPSPTLGVSCPVTSGPLRLKVSTVRASGISPFLVFFDATGTTDTSVTGNATTFQHVTYAWDFGDFGTSGTGTWAYGANAGHNSKNTATGGITAHLYVTSGTDTAYTAPRTATRGTNTDHPQMPVTAYCSAEGPPLCRRHNPPVP